ncbi:hypothetical protein PAXINDRAFT_20101 [Paxillus involutus ATCC 200175]|uniref:Uncharacterized protein n=1 Tax=Paxillus involutus ATCC 200175 TaxID=664439 RepID=A0A0C9T5Z2_PAXIN|nr:hypothetical protein PAXINDRAFT_20101 [Paxillus involutus ATCC 200175]
MSPRITSTSWFLEETGWGIFLCSISSHDGRSNPGSGACNLDARDYRSQLGLTILRLWDTVRWQEPEPMATKAPLKNQYPVGLPPVDMSASSQLVALVNADDRVVV